MTNKQTNEVMDRVARKDATRVTLKSTLRLLVTIRETLALQKVPADNPLLRSVVSHANMVGTLLPNDDLVSKQELNNIRAALGAAATKEVIEREVPSFLKWMKRNFKKGDGEKQEFIVGPASEGRKLLGKQLVKGMTDTLEGGGMVVLDPSQLKGK